MRVGSNLTVKENNAMVVGPNAKVYGNNCTVTGPNARVYGNNCMITGPNARVHGNHNIITGPNGYAKGNNNKLKGVNCKAKGTNNAVSSQLEGGGINVFNFNNQDQDDDLDIVIDDATLSIEKKAKRKKRVGGNIIQSNNTKKQKEIKFVEAPTESEMVHDIVIPDEAVGGGGGQCVVCLSKNAVCIVHPCRHVCCCIECARTLCLGAKGDELKERGKVKCPLCKEDAKSILRVFETK
jgi:hypothetical protein